MPRNPAKCPFVFCQTKTICRWQQGSLSTSRRVSGSSGICQVDSLDTKTEVIPPLQNQNKKPNISSPYISSPSPPPSSSSTINHQSLPQTLVFRNPWGAGTADPFPTCARFFFNRKEDSCGSIYVLVCSFRDSSIVKIWGIIGSQIKKVMDFCGTQVPGLSWIGPNTWKK